MYIKRRCRCCGRPERTVGRLTVYKKIGGSTMAGHAQTRTDFNRPAARSLDGHAIVKLVTR